MPRPANIYVFFGMIASGKSTLAQAFAEKEDVAYYNSDVLRKELAADLAKSSKNEKFNSGIYSAEFSRKTYDALLHKAAQELKKNRAVILDGSYQSLDERSKVFDLAADYKVSAHFILCSCPEELMKERMDIRAQDPNAVSDGRWEIYLKQKECFAQPKELKEPKQLIRITTDQEIKSLVATLQTML